MKGLLSIVNVLTGMFIFLLLRFESFFFLIYSGYKLFCKHYKLQILPPSLSLSFLLTVSSAEHYGLNWCFWSVVLEKGLESLLDCKEIKPVNPKGNQPWIVTERTDAEAAAPKLWSPDAKSQLTRKDPGAGKDWGQEEKGSTENEMVGWHHRLNGQEFEQTPEDSEGQGSLVCCSPWGCKESYMTEWLNNNGLIVCSQNLYVEVLMHSTLEWRCIWRQGLKGRN